MARGKPKKRKLRWIEAGDLHAGDIIVVVEGNIRKYYHVCEVSQYRGKTSIVYNTPQGFEREQCDDDDMLRIRL